jgi:hypothetical protein
VTVVAVLQIDTDFGGSLHLELLHSLLCLGNVDLVIALHNDSLLFLLPGNPSGQQLPSEAIRLIRGFSAAQIALPFFRK